MSSDNESPAVVELPDDLIEANAAAQLAVMRTAPPSLNDVIATVLIAAEPLIAARVRAEALREAVEKIAPNQVRPSNVIVVGARMTDDVLDMVRTVEDALVAAVRAEAVAGERRRIAAALDAEAHRVAEVPADTIRNEAYWAGRVEGVVSARNLAAGSVPVATPAEEFGAFSDSPRLAAVRAAIEGLPVGTEGQTLTRAFAEGIATVACRALLGPVATPQRPEIVVLCGSTRFKDAFRETAKANALAGRIVLTVSDLDPRPEARHVNVPIDAETKARLDELHRRKIDLADRVLVLNVGGYVGESTRSEIEYATAHGKPISYLESGPRLQPERVGFGTDAFEAGGSLPGQPVATPIEPAGQRCKGTLGERPSWMSEGQYSPCRCWLPDGHAGGCQCEHENDGVTPPFATSPVPAVQPQPCNCADFPGLAGEHSPWCGNTTGPRFSITGALPPAEQPEER